MKDPVKDCLVYKQIGCSHVDGYLCNFEECDIREKYEDNIRTSNITKKTFKTIAFDFDNVIHKYRKEWNYGIIEELNDDILLVIAELLKLGHYVFIMSTRSRKQIKKHFDSFIEEVNTHPSGNPDKGINYKTNDKIPFKYETFWHRKKFWNKKGVCGICNHKAMFDVLIDDRAITFKPQQGIKIEDILNFKIETYK